MSLKRGVLTSTGLNLLDHTVKAASVFILSPLMLRGLGKEAYGVWQVLMSVFGYFYLVDLGLTVSSSRFAARALGARDHEKWMDVLGACCRFYLRAGWVVFGLSCAIAGGAFFLAPGQGWSGPLLSAIALVYGLVSAVRFWTKPYGAALRSRLRYDLIALPAIARTVVQMGLLYALVASGHVGIGMIGLTMAACELGEVLVGAIISARVLRLPWSTLLAATHRPQIPHIRQEMNSHARASFLTAVGMNLRSRVDPVVVRAFAGWEMVAVYSVGARFVQMFEDIINALLGGPLLSAFSRIEGSGDKSRLVEAFHFTTAVGIFGSMAIGGGLVIFSPDFIERWMGADFRESATLLAILVPGYVLRLSQYSALNVFHSLGRPDFIARLTFFGGVFNIVVSVIVTWMIGPRGVAWGTTIELTLAALAVMPWLVSRLTGLSPWKYLGLVLGQTVQWLVPLAIYGELIRPWLRPDYGRLFLLGAGYGAVMAGWFWLVMLRRDERRMLLNILRRTPAVVPDLPS